MERPAGNERLFCSKPFDFFEPSEGGNAFLCCPSWLPRPVGRVGKGDPWKVWNGRRAQQIRASILDGSFRYCTHLCPHLHAIDGPVKRVRDVTDPEHRRFLEQQVTVVPRGPKLLMCSYDRSCNLACPTCRSGIIQASQAHRRDLAAMQSSLLAAFGPDLESLYVTGSGDPFGSPLFFELLRGLSAETTPRLRVLLHTNAQLFTEQRWQALEKIHPLIDFVEVSIDAASAATYHANRAPGSWDRLLDNLGFVAALRAAKKLPRLGFSFVVQANNWREMPAFVDLGRSFCADGVYFAELAQWWFPRRVLGVALGKVPVLPDDEFVRRAVHLPLHPEHARFVASLADPVFDRKGVSLGSLAALRPRAPNEPAPRPGAAAPAVRG